MSTAETKLAEAEDTLLSVEDTLDAMHTVAVNRIQGKLTDDETIDEWAKLLDRALEQIGLT